MSYIWNVLNVMGGHTGSFEEKVDQMIMMIIMIGDDPSTFLFIFYHRYTSAFVYILCVL